LGKPDIVFKQQNLVVFIDGCFWHGCRQHSRLPKSNVAYWRKKINGNKRRDRRITHELRRQGWRVVRIWEHETRTRFDALAATLSSMLKKSSRVSSR
jgi:DNA mismatch endonuclease (patch repair protein)